MVKSEMLTLLLGPYWNANFNLQNAKHVWQYLTFEFAAIRNLSTTIEEVQVPKSTKIHMGLSQYHEISNWYL